MFFRSLGWTFLVLPAWGVVGCGGSVEVNGTENGGGGAGGTKSTGEGGEGGASTGGGGAFTGSATGMGGSGVFCEEACATTADSGCFTSADCHAYCEANGADWPEDVGGAFAECAATNPLCFESVQGCMLSKLYPDGSVRHLTLKATGFEAQNGKAVFAWGDPDVGAPFGGQTVVENGAFSFDWMEPVAAFDMSSSLVLFYIDVDGDNECVPANDLTGSEFGTWNGDFVDPVYEIVLASPLSDPDFVCGSLP